MTLPGKAFLKRFCLHILPARFRKIRHYGFLANRTKTASLNIIKTTLLKKRHLANQVFPLPFLFCKQFGFFENP